MAKQKITLEKTANLIQKPIEEVMHSSMIPYAEYVILDRALPRVEDGLKPVQRRILYTMLGLNNMPDQPHRKSARIVGDCLGKYHPHGDTSIYDAMVRLAQDFNMRMTLVDGHGNFGSVDGDGAAAMRYTEARMAPLALELLRDIDKDTVDFSLNFDDTMLEPDVLPGRYPNLLVNGASGIAVGLATSIPPHNLGEVIDGVTAYIDNPSITLKQMMKYVKGPDFPTGGYVFPNELEQAYETGKGKITLRAKVKIENADNDRKNIVITELPYQSNKAALLSKIATLKEEKKDVFAGIYAIEDESDRSGMRAVIRLKKDTDVKKILAALFKYTSLETTFGMNMVAIAGGKPCLLPLLDIISYYVDYQRKVVFRRSKFDLNAAKAREHILEGLLIAAKNIDEVIKIIRSSANTTEARQNLRSRFGLSEKQADAILDMRLARLTKLEIFKLEKELSEVRERIKELQAIVDSKKRQLEIVKLELLDIKKKYRDPRRSVIVGADGEEAEVETVVDPENASSAEYVVVKNFNGNVKKVPAKNYSMSNREIADNPSLNEITPLGVKIKGNKSVFLFTDLGNCFRLDATDIPECRYREKGAPFRELCREAANDEKVVAIFDAELAESTEKLYMFTKYGYVKVSEWKEYAVSRRVFQAIKLKDDDRVIACENELKETDLLFITAGGFCLRAEKGVISPLGRVSAGVHGIQLIGMDHVKFAGQVGKDGTMVAITQLGFAKRVKLSGVEAIARYRKGVKLVDLIRENGLLVVYGDYVKEGEEKQIVIETEEEELFVANTADMQCEPRTGKGKQIKDFKKGASIAECALHLS